MERAFAGPAKIKAVRHLDPEAISAADRGIRRSVCYATGGAVRLKSMAGHCEP